jgi:hypothetical protein
MTILVIKQDAVHLVCRVPCSGQENLGGTHQNRK